MWVRSLIWIFSGRTCLKGCFSGLRPTLVAAPDVNAIIQNTWKHNHWRHRRQISCRRTTDFLNQNKKLEHVKIKQKAMWATYKVYNGKHNSPSVKFKLRWNRLTLSVSEVGACSSMFLVGPIVDLFMVFLCSGFWSPLSHLFVSL